MVPDTHAPSQSTAGSGSDAGAPDTDRSVRRRSVLAAVAGLGSALGSGCVRRAQSLVDRSSPSRVSLTIKTVPADTDDRSTRIARFLATRLQEVGIAAQVMPMSREELFRDVLLNGNFDLYVARRTDGHDPDVLWSLLHSQFVTEPGWQNPFGFANLRVDELLDAQRSATGAVRTQRLRSLQRSVVRTQPFTVVAFPDEIRVSDPARTTGWDGNGPRRPLDYLRVRPVEDRLDGAVGADNATGPNTSTDDDTDASVATDANASTRPDALPGIVVGDDSNASTPTPDTVVGDDSNASTPTPDTVVGDDSNASTITGDDAGPGPLRAAITDSRATENLNPLAVEFRNQGAITGLIYDSLARWHGGEVRPWAAEDWTWTDDGSGAPEATVRLRSDLTWHDGSDLTAEDVAFTYRFLHDTSLGRMDSPVPAPVYRGRSALVDTATPIDDRRVRIRFAPASREVAVRSFTVPLLPKAVWSRRTAQATLAGVNAGGAVTEALVSNNIEPIGSGPLQFGRTKPEKTLLLDPFDEHFLADDPDEAWLAPYVGGFAFDGLELVTVPSDQAAVQLVKRGAVDVTGSTVAPALVPHIARSDRVTLHVDEPTSFYHVGFNVQRTPTTNPRFRRAVARLLDKEFVAEEVFDGYARPAASPLATYAALAPDLAWEGEDPVLPFVGDDGTLDADRARDLFRKAGYRYSNRGGLLAR